MPIWVTGFLLKRVLPAMIVLAALGYAVTRIEAVGYQRGYDSRWAETLPKEIRDDYARAKLTDEQRWATRIADFTMLVSSVVRSNAEARYRLAAADLTAGLGQRVSDAEARLRACSVPPAGAGGSAPLGGAGGAERLAELRRREQAVYDAAGQCGAQEESLMVKPLCECPR